VDCGGGQSFVLAVIELREEGRERWSWKAGELGGAPGALEGARVNGGKVQTRQARAKRGRVCLATSSEP
jgi:hypothetical protein